MLKESSKGNRNRTRASCYPLQSEQMLSKGFFPGWEKSNEIVHLFNLEAIYESELDDDNEAIVVRVKQTRADFPDISESSFNDFNSDVSSSLKL